MACTGLMSIKRGTGGESLWMHSWTFKFHKMQGVSWLAEDLLVSQEEQWSIESDSYASTSEFLFSTISGGLLIMCEG